MGLGFTVLPKYAVKAFANQRQIKIHQLAHSVSEPLLLATHSRITPTKRTQMAALHITRWLEHIQ